MGISKELINLIEDRKKGQEKFEVYNHVFKFKDSDEDFFYYAIYKIYQQGKGHIVLSSSRKLIPKSEAVKIAYYFLTHNGTISAALGPISDTKKRKVEVAQKIQSRLIDGKDFILSEGLGDSYKMIIETLQLQINNTKKVNEIYNQIKELDLHIQRKTHILTEDLWEKGRNLLQEYNGTMYHELKTLLETWNHAEKVIDHLNQLNLKLLEKHKAKAIIKQLQILFNDQAKNETIKSLEGFEKDFQGNFFTNKRGELSTEEYIQRTYKMMETEYMMNLQRDNRNP